VVTREPAAVTREPAAVTRKHVEIPRDGAVVMREPGGVPHDPAEMPRDHAHITRDQALVTRDRDEIPRDRREVPGERREVLRADAPFPRVASTTFRALANNRHGAMSISASGARNFDPSSECIHEGRETPRPRKPEIPPMTTTRLKPSKSAALTSVQGLVSGTLAHFPDNTFNLGQNTFTTASLVQRLQKLADAIIALNAAQAAAKQALFTVQEAQADVDPVIQAYKRFVFATYFDSVATLADFHLAPPKVPAPRTVEQKAVAAAKLRATRKARGTTSKKQKLAIKGNVTGIVVTPITSPAAPVEAGKEQP